MRTALVTGSCGFCGRHLVRHLASLGDIRVFGTDILPAPTGGLAPGDYYAADLTDSAQARSLLEKVRPDLLFHLAGVAGGSPGEVYRVNLLAGVNLLEAARWVAPQVRILIVGSAAEYGEVPAKAMPITEDHPCRPRGAYGLSKYALTLAALDYHASHRLQVVVMRPFNIIGAGVPATLVVGALLQRLKAALKQYGEASITVGNLDTERDFIAVEDVVHAYVAALESGQWGQVFNICSGEPRSIRSVVECLSGLSPRPVNVRVDPALLRPGDVKIVFGSAVKARLSFGFEPSRKLDEALTAAWQAVMD